MNRGGHQRIDWRLCLGLAVAFAVGLGLHVHAVAQPSQAEVRLVLSQPDVDGWVTQGGGTNGLCVLEIFVATGDRLRDPERFACNLNASQAALNTTIPTDPRLYPLTLQVDAFPAGQNPDSNPIPALRGRTEVDFPPGSEIRVVMQEVALQSIKIAAQGDSELPLAVGQTRQ
uniref:hypothetical protein n=1 Tax=Candidatus Entotheonella palauensis TaxID=93172 RepID=UPI00117890B4